MKFTMLVFGLLFYLLIEDIPFILGMKMLIRKIELCDPNIDYENKIFIKPYLEGEKQYFDGNATLRIPLSNEMKAHTKVELGLGGNYIPVVSFSDQHACLSIHKYLGEFVYDIERAAGITPGLCPISKGRYRINHLLVESNKISLQSLPLGSLRITIQHFLNKTHVVLCLRSEVDNV